MSKEYVKLTPPELISGETNLLQSQFSLVTMLKQYKEYKALRKEELFLKIELKKRFGEAKVFLDELSKYLPESKLLEEQEKKERLQRELAEKIESAVQSSRKKEWKYWAEKDETQKEQDKGKEEVLSLDQELEEIRKKLDKLQS